MKKIVFSLFVICLIAYSFFFPEITVNAAQNGLETWFQQILPTLLPFTILSAILVKSDFLKSFHGNANLLACLFTFACGFVFGFPVGAKLSSDFYKQGLLSQKQATILSIATNNFSPMYVCGFGLPLLFASKEYNIATYWILYFTPLLLATCYFILTFRCSDETAEVTSFHLNMNIIDCGILSSFEILIKICGYIVLFSVTSQILISILASFATHPPLILTILIGNLEITNGISLLSACIIDAPLKYIFVIQLLSLGGLSGIAQTCSILSDAGLSIPKYIIGKALLSLLLTLLSVIYVFFSHLL